MNPRAEARARVPRSRGKMMRGIGGPAWGMTPLLCPSPQSRGLPVPNLPVAPFYFEGNPPFLLAQKLPRGPCNPYTPSLTSAPHSASSSPTLCRSPPQGLCMCCASCLFSFLQPFAWLGPSLPSDLGAASPRPLCDPSIFYPLVPFFSLLLVGLLMVHGCWGGCASLSRAGKGHREMRLGLYGAWYFSGGHWGATGGARGQE